MPVFPCRAVYVSSEPLVAIPDVVGKQQYTAGADLDAAGFFTDRVSYQASLVYSEGQVISPSPVAGTMKPVGTAIALLVSSGASPVNVPDIVGMQLAEARVVLNQQGLRLGQVAFQDVEGIPVGEVMSQEPPGLARVAPGSPVTLIVSGTAEEVPVEGEGELPVEGETEGEVEEEGEAPTEGETPAEGEIEVVVVDVLSMTPQNARIVLEDAGFVVEETSECSDMVNAGAVIRQSPVGGSRALAGSTVTLVISTGPCGEDTGGCCQSGAKAESPGDVMKRMLGDWLLVGLSLAVLLSGVARKW